MSKKKLQWGMKRERELFCTENWFVYDHECVFRVFASFLFLFLFRLVSLGLGQAWDAFCRDGEMGNMEF